MNRFLAVLLLVSWSPAFAADPLAPNITSGNPTEKRLSVFVSDYTKGFYAFEPAWATTMGLHFYDHVLEDRSRAAIDREVERTRQTIALMKGINAVELSDSARIDFDLFQSQVEGHLFDLTEIRRWENDPNAYNYAEAIYPLVARNFDSQERRLLMVTERLKQVPRLLASGKQNVKNPPAMFAELAGEDFEGTIEFLEKEVPGAFSSVKDPALLKGYEVAKAAAVAATRDYIEWVRKDLVPRAKGSYVLGPERYRKKLHYDEMVDLSLDSVLRVGEQELGRLEARYEAAGKKIDPSASVDDLVQRMRADHPTADGLIPYANGLLEDIRSYCISSKFIDVPSEVRCTVRPTPSFAASRSFASLDAPGPFEKKANEVYYNITVPGAGWDSARVEQHLQGYSRWMLPSVSIHEAYPGHYVHFLFSKRAPSLVRQTMGCGSFAEGWGLYVEEGLVDHGYRKDDPRVEFGMLRWALVRACRFQVGLRVHTKGMTMDEAIAFFMKHAHMEKANAERESYRAAFDPTYIVYTLGALQIRKLRDDVMRAEGTSFDLARFHARILSQGALPVALLRRMLLHDSGPTL
ncbi:MAG TPA: DUF885 domain-containing protein [Candidatus Limnocylindrales bacterium]|nr:DUF885 domain-containing protein [Candidatus Limnocylindrales bacterium]